MNLIEAMEAAVAERVTDEDYYEGDEWVYYTLNGYPNHSDKPRHLVRVYQAGDVLPAGEPMPANALIESVYSGERFYVRKGARFHHDDKKILWLEGEQA